MSPKPPIPIRARLTGILLGVLALTGSADGAGTTNGLEALYDFSSTIGPIVKDRSGAGEPVDLKIDNLEAVERKSGSLIVKGDTLIASGNNASRITEAVRRSDEITIEAWIHPSGKDQKGPARILTFSKNSNERNFTLGQEGDRYDVRLRTTGTSKNGIPSVASKAAAVQTRLTHLVYTRDRSGRTRIFIDGKLSTEETRAGALDNWDGNHRLALANEFGGGRSWKGTYRLVALYSRALSPKDVEKHFEAGPDASGEPSEPAPAPLIDAFTTQVAPILAEHCLECHDTATRKGNLDLSKRETALKGGEEGPPIVAGHADKSLLWESIAADDMPKKRTPLSGEEKQILKDWINQGAPWSLEFIDPVVYAHGDKGEGIWVQRLTVPEYIETVSGAVGVDISKEARELLPKDIRADGFSNTAYNLTVDFAHIGAYAELAAIIVSRMDVLAFAERFSKSRKLIDDDNRALIGEMGKWILRGPLDPRELNAFRGISTTIMSSGGDFQEATTYVLEAMLQSPRFLYRIESQVGDGAPRSVDPFELASRLSYTIWGGAPDKALMSAASDGRLADTSAIEAEVLRMLDDPRTRTRARTFIHEWLNLGRLESLRPDPQTFPSWDHELASDMRKETVAFFEEIALNQNRPLADLLNAQVSFLSPKLAKHYGLPPGDSAGNRYDLAAVPERGGLLTQGSVLTIGGDGASTVTRGLFVLHNLLRGVIKDPPPCVNTTPPSTRTGLTRRGIAEERIADRTCGGCHAKFEPLSFGLEKFNGLGAYSENDEHGNAQREDGQILFPGSAEPVPYETISEMMNQLAASERVRESLTWKLAQFALGRPLGVTDAPILAKVHQQAMANGGTYNATITALVLSDLIQKTRTEAE